MAIVFFALENLTFLAKIRIYIPECTEEEGGGSTSLGNIPKKSFFLVLPLQSHLIQTFPFCKALSLQLQLIVSSALRYNKFLTDGASVIRWCC